MRARGTRRAIGRREVVNRAVDEAVSVVRKLIDEVTVDRMIRNAGKESELMFKRLFATAVILGVAYVVVTSLPDIARYIQIREM